jgi:maltose alpha-D-glucosyltransferase/alpha-amylase
MVTDDERDYMYAEYAKDPRMKRNIGIGRRLATLVDNDRPLQELLHGLLFSLPGSPVLYYGDEIGMGDNIYLGDRDGVRTPMQWTPDRNAGFSRGDFAQLYLPPLMDPVFGYQAVNVEAQMRNPSSFLYWIQRALQVRKRHNETFGMGTFEILQAENPSVLAFIRQYGEEILLCVNNLSRFAQPVELYLSKYAGRTPVELVGRVPFPRIGELPYLLTLAGHGFYWFQLVES